MVGIWPFSSSSYYYYLVDKPEPTIIAPPPILKYFLYKIKKFRPRKEKRSMNERLYLIFTWFARFDFVSTVRTHDSWKMLRALKSNWTHDYYCVKEKMEGKIELW
jgi:hypothetical protein